MVTCYDNNLRTWTETLVELRPRDLIKETPQKGFHPLAKRKTAK